MTVSPQGCPYQTMPLRTAAYFHDNVMVATSDPHAALSMGVVCRMRSYAWKLNGLCPDGPVDACAQLCMGHE